MSTTGDFSVPPQKETYGEKPSDAGTSGDPFSYQEAPGVSLIVLMRIYDVMMGMYTEMAPDKADAMIEAHAQGILIGSTPAFNGRFVTSEEMDQPTDPGPA